MKSKSNQTSHQFANEKKQTLSKVDKSIAASIDEPIREIVNHINELENYFTTSSCSGRIIVTGSRKQPPEPDQDKEESVKYNLKKDLKWLYNSHTLITDNGDELISQVEQHYSDYTVLTLKFEPAILHIRSNSSDDLSHARRLLNTAIAAGYRNSGMVLSQSQHCTVAVRSTAAMEVPLVDDSLLLVDAQYLRHLTTIANRKLTANFELLERLHKSLQEL